MATSSFTRSIVITDQNAIERIRKTIDDSPAESESGREIKYKINNASRERINSIVSRFRN